MMPIDTRSGFASGIDRVAMPLHVSVSVAGGTTIAADARYNFLLIDPTAADSKAAQ
jgi:hypothetical protein